MCVLQVGGHGPSRGLKAPLALDPSYGSPRQFAISGRASGSFRLRVSAEVAEVAEGLRVLSFLPQRQEGTQVASASSTFDNTISSIGLVVANRPDSSAPFLPQR